MKRFHPFFLLVLFLGFAVATARSQNETAIQAVKDAIQKAEAARPGSLTKDKVIYSDAYLLPILVAIENYFSKPAAKILNACLEFEPHYYESHEYTKLIRKDDPNAKYKPIGGAHTYVEVEEKSRAKHIESYTVKSGNIEVLQGAESVCLALELALKDTQLDSREARRRCSALKTVHSLMQQLPRYARQYLEVEGVAALRYKNRLAQVSRFREELVAVQKDWRTEMSRLKQ